ncbi:hypothetical protein ABIF65_007937 [Bradyrhizobium japonicum]|uniref:DUF1254 domain-containing protein n=1 Tax=Bradyrhizobium barranii subsp. barranii TaxID=2823807 RepID=A0A939M0S1_9BRAD|nr:MULTISPECIES: DUF1254 domain-containing protein [Bradyrhizobium]MBR1003629.1 DUF1254 domain-containing protein [Bradyrhizobium liaoningense]MBR1069884.1 DUF1254 domain-containing protein [Bradyrhizobium liaoningense]MCP1773619.1 hypothetical protein [Bradyrhizobium japonicum]MCP1863880.1 hypothetical protein [Bradyrhizobium japonicum]MCP1963380.1 hypothetical protein [Bradyrhizobium japonicum]
MGDGHWMKSISLRRRDLGLGALALGAAAALLRPSAAESRAERLGQFLKGELGELKDLKGDAKEEIAYLLGMECYVYGFPLVLMDVTNGVVTATSKSEEYKAPFNQFGRMRGYVSPDFKDVVRISVSTVWSFAILDLDKEPMIASHPDTKGRYIVLQLMNMWTDDFASIGSRTTGSGAGKFLIAGPKWNGTAPADVKDVYRCPTRFAWLLVQMSAAGPQDFPEIHALQDQLQITPLSAWGKPYTPPSNVPVDPAVDLTATPYDQVRLMTGEMFFKRLARLLKDNPPYPADTGMLDKLRKFGIEPGKEFDTSKLDPAIIRGLNAAPAEVWLKFQAALYDTPAVNGWLNMLNLGRYGTDYNTRALIAWLGLGALTSDDAVYPSAFVDGDGNVLDGAAKYVLHFGKDEFPPSASGVWSVSPYRENFYVRNSLNRYGILSGMPLKYNADGSLDIYIQATTPGADNETNWLPCPPSLPFNLTIRAYQPSKPLLDGSYKIPPVKRTG